MPKNIPTAFFDIDELLGKKEKKEMGGFTLQVFEAIRKKWPTNPLEVANEFGDNGTMKAMSARYLYHFRKLKKMGLIDMKKIGNSYVAWPVEVEKFRVIHELLKG